MNEQQLADLFTEQLDKMLAGNAIEAPVEELSGLLDLGQQLTQVRFQASPAAQAAFQGQLASWFGSAGGAGLGLSKGMLMTLMMAVGAGIGLVALVSSLLGGDILNNSGAQMPDTSLPAMATPVETLLPIETLPATSTPVTPTTESVVTSSEGDTLPSFSTLGDTVITGTLSVTTTQNILPLPTMTSTITSTITVDGNQPDDEDEGGSSGKDDHDRGHGNDLDGVDEDNPGNSSGVGSGNDKDKDNQGKSEGKKE